MTTDREDQEAWDAIADFWHDRMAEGNDFVDVLIWPVVRRLLPPLKGLRVLDIGCGNGLYSRKLATEGAVVHAIDYSAKMIERARAVTRDPAIEYMVVDASDDADLARLPTNGFDAAICTMVLMDMTDVDPLFRSLPRILTRRGSFVFATAHPCFNSPHAHLEERSQSSEIAATPTISARGVQDPKSLLRHGDAPAAGEDALLPPFDIRLASTGVLRRPSPRRAGGTKLSGRPRERPAKLLGRPIP